MLNKVILNGKLPRFEAIYSKGEGEKKSYLTWCISVKRDYKKPDEQYYKEDLIKFKAFGPKADFIMNNFAMGDGLILEGKLQIEDDYTDKEGNAVKGQLFVMVDAITFADYKTSNSENTKAPNNPPAIPGAPTNRTMPPIPGAKSNSIPTPPIFNGGRPSAPGTR